MGLVDHGGGAWNSDQSYHGPKMFVGGIANAGAAVKPVGWLRLQFDAEDFVYFAHLGPCTRSGPGSGVCATSSESGRPEQPVRGSKTISCCPSGSRLPQVTERHFTVPLRD